MLRFVAAVSIVAIPVSLACSRGTESFGNAAISGINYADWPNVMPVINDGYRVHAGS
jgi:hypothetical protein